MPAHPATTAINPHSIPFFMEISFGAVVRLAHPDLDLARAIPPGINGSHSRSRRHVTAFGVRAIEQETA